MNVQPAQSFPPTERRDYVDLSMRRQDSAFTDLMKAASPRLLQLSTRQRMTQCLVERDLIRIAAADFCHGQVTSLDKFGDDFLHHAFSNPDQCRHLSQRNLRVSIQAQKYMRVICQKRSAGRGHRRYLRHGRGFNSRFHFLSLFHKRCSCAELKCTIINTRTRVRVFLFAKQITKLKNLPIKQSLITQF